MRKTVAVKQNGADVAQKTEARPRSTLIYMNEDLIRRLGHFLQDKYAGKQHMRSQVVVAAVEQMLEKEGY